MIRESGSGPRRLLGSKAMLVALEAVIRPTGQLFDQLALMQDHHLDFEVGSILGSAGNDGGFTIVNNRSIALIVESAA